MPQIKLVLIRMNEDHLFVRFFFRFAEPHHQVTVIWNGQDKMLEASVALHLHIASQLNVKLHESGLPVELNNGFHVAIGNFKLFMEFKERFVNDKIKIMNTFFQPFEMNNILIFNFQNSAE